MAQMPKGGPRSVPDPAGERAEAAVAQPPVSSVGHPGFAESLIPVWGSGREAVADFQEGDYAGAALNGALAASDLFLAGSIAKGLRKAGSTWLGMPPRRRRMLGKRRSDPGWSSRAI